MSSIEFVWWSGGGGEVGWGLHSHLYINLEMFVRRYLDMSVNIYLEMSVCMYLDMSLYVPGYVFVCTWICLCIYLDMSVALKAPLLSSQCKQVRVCLL